MRVADEIKKDPQARIILCHAEPHWVYKQMYQRLDPAYNEDNLAFLEKRLGRTVAVFLARDQHHYRHYKTRGTPETHKITAGGGGAFLHPTHTGWKGTDLHELQENSADGHGVQSGRTFCQITCFPTEEESRRLCWHTLIFPYLQGNKSKTFGLMTAGFYLLSTLSLLGNLQAFPLWSQSHVTQLCDDCWPLLGRWNSGTFAQLTGWTLDTVLSSPPTFFWVLLMVAGFILLTDTHSPLYRWTAGPIHAISHVLAAFAIALGSIVFVMKLTSPAWVSGIMWGGYRLDLDWRAVPAAALIILGGYVVGSLIMGAYLLVSLSVCGRHWNEAFSALAIQDWKHFLRLHIDQKGDLTIYPIGLRRVPRHWKAREGQTGPELEPDDPKATKPLFIERPVKVEGSQAQCR